MGWDYPLELPAACDSQRLNQMGSSAGMSRQDAQFFLTF